MRDEKDEDYIRVKHTHKCATCQRKFRCTKTCARGAGADLCDKCFENTKEIKLSDNEIRKGGSGGYSKYR